MKRIIGLLQIGDLDRSVLVNLKKNLESAFKEFNISINIIPKTITLEETEYNRVRRQYDASKILNKIKYYAKDTQFFRILGLLDTDIYSGSLNFVFGIAFSPNINNPLLSTAALISITRLREKFYRRPESSVIFELRILKEAVHELGHTFTLRHCNNFCIMRFSNSLTETDHKPQEYCESCLNKLKSILKLKA